ncbi:Auxin response factor [Quillaja saponaria]|uniref:Auxin response factor n=1 Tax=Quillaja saponaria TaxID=32244 RepID=A0AAD7Q9S9_QUISA|nr:Auxin response factor [Quillaja saponaria]
MVSVDVEKDGFSATSAANGRRKCKDGGFCTENNQNQGEEDDLYTELWLACAGQLVYVPRSGEMVYYFPQGHMEQVEACTGQDSPTEMPTYNLPYKILCRVAYVELKAEPYTDEVFAQVTLLPVANDEHISEDKCAHVFPRTTSACSISKTLTPSDTSNHGGFSIRRRHAEDCLPPLDMSQEPPAQDLVAKDLHGFKWHFRHIYRGKPKRHLLTSGWSTFLNSKKLVAGDACIFVRGENGELRIGICRAKKQQNSASISVLSGHSMQHGILASASHARSFGTIFTVYYRPWTSPFEFIIPLDRYMKSTKIDHSIGMRFRMQVEAEECARKRYTGTVVGIEDIDGIRWPGSKWRCLLVEWDETSDTFMHPHRVSPWSIDPIESPYKKHTPLHPAKRPRTPDLLLPGFPRLAKDDALVKSVKHKPQGDKEVLQGQDKNVYTQHAQKTFTLPDIVSPSNYASRHSQLGMENQLHCQGFHQYPRNPISFPDLNTLTPGLPNQWSPISTTNGVFTISKDIPISNVNSSIFGSPDCRSSESRDENEVLLCQPDDYSRYKLFGVCLSNSHSELPSQQLATFSKYSVAPRVLPTSQSSINGTNWVSAPSKSISGASSRKQCKRCSSVTSRSCIKVHKYGTALGRSVDLTHIHKYDELTSELDWMFEFRGSLIDGSSGWQVTFTDDDGDIMLVGDCSWQHFQSIVQKIFICPKED